MIRTFQMSCELCICLFFFFFKQKTAYEMRISDWSSDVCSSDLDGCGCANTGTGNCRKKHTRQHDRQREPTPHRPYQTANQLYHDHDNIAAHHQEIGRASCRERVCQYV